MKTVFLPDHTGALGHRLRVGIHMLAAAIEWNFRLVNLALAPYRTLFRELRRGPCGSYPGARWPCPYLGPWLRLVRKPLAAWARRLPGRPFGWHYPQTWMDCASPALPEALRPYRWNVFWGDRFGSDALVARHGERIREFFGLSPEFRVLADGLLQPAREENARCVVVHVRQGDFATWADGAHFFSESEYAARMREIRDGLAPRKVNFVICSQHALNYGAFTGLVVRHQTRDLKEDFAVIQRADFCLATVSSFARTACFLGRVPLAVMTKSREPLAHPSAWAPPTGVS